MEPKLKKRNEASGERVVEKPLRGKVQNQDFSTSLGNPPNPRISTFPQPRRRRLFISYLEVGEPETQTRPRPRLTYRKQKMVLTTGSTLLFRNVPIVNYLEMSPFCWCRRRTFTLHSQSQDRRRGGKGRQLSPFPPAHLCLELHAAHRTCSAA